MDIPGAAEQVAKILADSLGQVSTTFVAFPRPLREYRVRVLSTFPVLPDGTLLRELAALPLDRIEVHCEKSHLGVVKKEMESMHFCCLHVVHEVRCGYLTVRRRRMSLKSPLESKQT